MTRFWLCVGVINHRSCMARLGDLEWPVVRVHDCDYSGLPSLTVKCRSCGTLNRLRFEDLQTSQDQDKVRVMA